MPELLTHPLEDPAAWRGAEMAKRKDWIVPVSQEHIRELDSALDGIRRRGIDLFRVTREDFPLPGFGKVLEGVRGDLEGGRGFAVLRGLPVERWSEEEAALAFWGMGHHLGLPERQDGAGNLLHHVRDTGEDFDRSDTLREYQTNRPINFHNDGADAFGLFCLSQGSSGGRSLLVSAIEVFNEVLRRRPDLAEILQQPFYMDTRGQRPDGAKVQAMPMFNWHAPYLSANYKNSLIYKAQRFPEVPRLTDKQEEALKLLDEICYEPEIVLGFQLQAGDIELANNYVTFHAREAFADDDGLGGGDGGAKLKRHLLRLWVTLPNGRPLPETFRGSREFGATYARRMEGAAA